MSNHKNISRYYIFKEGMSDAEKMRAILPELTTKKELLQRWEDAVALGFPHAQEWALDMNWLCYRQDGLIKELGPAPEKYPGYEAVQIWDPEEIFESACISCEEKSCHEYGLQSDYDEDETEEDCRRRYRVGKVAEKLSDRDINYRHEEAVEIIIGLQDFSFFQGHLSEEINKRLGDASSVLEIVSILNSLIDKIAGDHQDLYDGRQLPYASLVLALRAVERDPTKAISCNVYLKEFAK